MPLPTYALVTVQELKDFLPLVGTAQDTVLETVITEATDEIENLLGRQIVYRGTPYVEYHTMRVNGRDLGTDELRPREWPIISISELCEDLNWPRTYPVGSRLTVDTDYQIVKGQPRDFLRRLSAGSVALGWYWPTGLRTDNLSYGPAPRPIRLTYTAGYASTAAVPPRIKAQTKRYAALLWAERNRGAYGVSSQSDALGNFTRFGPAKITDDMATALYDDTRVEFYETGEPA